jgi:hypothetical protein
MMSDIVFRNFDTPEVTAWAKRNSRASDNGRAVWLFDSYTQYVNASAGEAGGGRGDMDRASRHESSTFTDFTGTKDYGTAKDLALHGWSEGTERVQSMSASMSGTMSVQRYGMELALTGGAVDVPTFLTGEHECMWTWQASPAKRGAKIVIEGSAASGVKPEQILQRGAAIVSLIDALESGGISTEAELRFTLTDPSSSHVLQHRVTLKQASDALDIPALAFAVAHPSSLRRIGFGVMERSSAALRDRFEFGMPGRYGYATQSLASEFTEGEVFIASNLLTSGFGHSVEWIRSTAAKFGVDIA